MCEFEYRSWQGVLYGIFGDNDCQWFVAGRWFSTGTPVSSTNESDSHDIAVILLKVAINTITLTIIPNQQDNTNQITAKIYLQLQDRTTK